jgi:hypothetical protein
MAPKAFDRQKAKVKVSDDQLTPIEIARFLEGDGQLRFAIAPLLKSGQRPAAYIREAWSEDATYFTSGRGATRLIIAFSSPAGRLGISISYFLQMLRDHVYDVVLLRDPSQLHYTHGIRGFGTYFETMRRLEDFADSKRYSQIITLGASLGGLPALRGGRLLKARRAISIGGRYVWHPGRLARKERSVHAFDLLCACAPPSPTELVVVYAQRNEEDKSAFELLKRTFPECTPVPIDIEEHNIFHYFHNVRLLPLLLACLFDYWDEVEIRTDLLARLEQAARHTLLWQKKRAVRVPINQGHGRMREWFRTTPLWPFNLPVRALRRVLRHWRSGSP